MREPTPTNPASPLPAAQAVQVLDLAPKERSNPITCAALRLFDDSLPDGLHTPDGTRIGTLAIADRRPRRFGDGEGAGGGHCVLHIARRHWRAGEAIRSHAAGGTGPRAVGGR